VNEIAKLAPKELIKIVANLKSSASVEEKLLDTSVPAGFDGAMHFNDDRGTNQAKIIKAFDRAIKLAEKVRDKARAKKAKAKK
jgi:hypothetical protein